MRPRFRLPLFVVAAAMIGLMAVLATLQYQWLGRISDAERERMSAMLNTRATAFAQDFDRELTRAFLLFQADAGGESSTAARLSARYDRWQATARFPRMIGSIYVVPSSDGGGIIERFNLATRFVEPAEWPEPLKPLRAHLTPSHEMPVSGTFVFRPALAPVLEDVPAIVVPTPIIFFDQQIDAKLRMGAARLPARMSYTVLVLDREYLVNELLPAIAEQHFRGSGDVEYQLAVVRTAAKDTLYRSTPGFSPAPDAVADASADLFQVRTQEFGALAAEVRRFATFVARSDMHSQAPQPPGSQAGDTTIRRQGRAILRETIMLPPDGTPSGNPQVSIVMQPQTPLTPAQKTALGAGLATATARAASTPKWRLLVKHPSGSLEAAVRTAQTRNMLVSSGILVVLGASVLLLVVSTRRAQRLAAQQMEFVAAVSHELRTPLAVIRSAGENLADGVIRDEQQIRRYGDLVRQEGRRLTEMVEQTLELAGIQSGQRGFALRPVAIRALVDDVLGSSSALIEHAGVRVEVDIPESVPPVLGDEPALRRVVQNLIANALKYGDAGKWIGVRAQAAGRDVVVSVSDRGIGIAPGEHQKIFEPFYRTPDVVAAQIHGAGLGLSLVKRIVEAHGGRISVRSAPGQGSEFTVRLPASEQEPIVEPRLHRRGAPHAAGFPS